MLGATLTAKNKKILCTLGPASFDVQIIKRLENLGVNLFRINLSHTKLKDLPNLIRHIQNSSAVPICLDTEGAQIRTGDFSTPDIYFHENTLIYARKNSVPGNSLNFNFAPREVVSKIEIGDFVSIDFNSVLAQVIGRENNDVIMRVLNGGPVGRNKAVTIEREIELPALTHKDINAIKVGKNFGISHFALSFANSHTDVELLRNLAGENAFIISKIESLSGLMDLENISKKSDAILIDRGDLSRQVPLELIPNTQKNIIKIGKTCKKEVFVATNLLESMVSNAVPTRAEVNDIYNTLLDGADGLVLAAETAIGDYPVECASMVVKIMRHFQKPPRANNLFFPMEPISLLNPPHGGKLVNQYANDDEKCEAEKLRHITISETALLDCEQIAHGTYSPIKGFMEQKTLNSVLNDYCLLDGTVWTMPILLQVSEQDFNASKVNEKVALKGKDGVLYAILKISELFRVDLADLARRWFASESQLHPGIASLYHQGEFVLAGEVKLIKRLPSFNRCYELTPAHTRFIFARKGWSEVIGFHTRNPVHRGHEYIQKQALKDTGADGLYVNPVVGPKKAGDFQHAYIMKSYQTMLDFGIYPQGKVVLGAFATYSRYGGPREAVFTALCRKNMGCSYFIIGRDHTGVADIYTEDANMKLFECLGDLGIKPLFFPSIGFNPKTDTYEALNIKSGCLPIDGTSIRDALREDIKVEDWKMREIVQEALVELRSTGEAMFVEAG